MNDTPNGPEQVPNAAPNDPAWGPPNPNYPPPAGQYPPGYVPPAQYPPQGYAQRAGLSTNTAAALAYITFIPAVIFLVIEPYKRDTYIRFHAWQCIVLTLVDIAGGVVFGFMGTIGLMVRSVLGLLLFVFWLIAIIRASKGERYHVPIVGDLAETLAAKV
jgi:uncharacterized membrane protein